MLVKLTTAFTENCNTDYKIERRKSFLFILLFDCCDKKLQTNDGNAPHCQPK
jgi:hypothetical protein